MSVMSVTDFIPKELSLIVYRYVHRSQYKEVITQYDTDFGQYWSDKSLLFYDANTHLELMWRDLTDLDFWINPEGNFVYKHVRSYSGQIPMLPKKY